MTEKISDGTVTTTNSNRLVGERRSASSANLSAALAAKPLPAAGPASPPQSQSSSSAQGPDASKGN
jgi:hypothetical protein